MNRTLKDATGRRYHDETRDGLGAHLKTFLDADNLSKCLKIQYGMTIFGIITEKASSEPGRSRLHPNHLNPGPNSWPGAASRSLAFWAPLECCLVR